MGGEETGGGDGVTRQSEKGRGPSRERVDQGGVVDWATLHTDMDGDLRLLTGRRNVDGDWSGLFVRRVDSVIQGYC
jgi:hypothetical protein